MKKHLLFAHVGLLVASVSGSQALAATAAGTKITNQASASFIDSSGSARTITSNLVETVVREVYGLSVFNPSGAASDNSPVGAVLDAQKKQGVTGASVMFPYALVNTGNSTDNFNLFVEQLGGAFTTGAGAAATAPSYTSATTGASDNFDFGSAAPVVYYDANSNGLVDPGEQASSSIQLDAGQVANLLVRVQVPSNVTTAGHVAKLRLIADSAGSQISGNSLATKSDVNNWSQATLVTSAVMTSTLSGPSSVTPGTAGLGAPFTYTISGSNTGGAAAYGVDISTKLPGATGSGIVIKNMLPGGVVFNGSASGTSGAGGALQYYYTTDATGNSGWTTTAPSDLTTVRGVAMVIPSANTTSPFFAQGASYSFSFSAKSRSSEDMPAGTSVINSAVLTFDSDGSAGAEAPTDVSTNPSTTTVNAVKGVKVGPKDDALAAAVAQGTAYTVQSSTVVPSAGFSAVNSGNTADTYAFSADSQVISSDVVAGTTAYFMNTIRNTGNSDDVFNILVNSSDPKVSCSVLQVDGITPIASGLFVKKGETANFVVACRTAGDVALATSFNGNITVTSQTDANSTDTTVNVFDVDKGAVTDAVIDPSISDADGDGKGDLQGTPGAPINFPFSITNGGLANDTFNVGPLTPNTLPNGTVILIYPDANGDGIADPGSSPINNTGVITPGDTVNYVAVITLPANAPATDITDSNTVVPSFTLQIKSTTNPDVVDNIQGEIQILSDFTSNKLSFTPNRSNTTAAPGTVDYIHTLVNTSNAVLDVSFNNANPNVVSSKTNWTYLFSQDGTNFATTQTVRLAANNGALGGLDEKPIYVRVLVPSGEAIGAVDVATITGNATDAPTYADPTATSGGGVGNQEGQDIGGGGGGALLVTVKTATKSVLDTTTVVSSDLRLVKTIEDVEEAVGNPTATVADNKLTSEARPGDVVVYQVVASNIGSAALKRSFLVDPVPTYTDFYSLSVSDLAGTASNSLLISNDGTTWTTVAALDADNNGVVTAVEWGGTVDWPCDEGLTNCEIGGVDTYEEVNGIRYKNGVAIPTVIATPVKTVYAAVDTNGDGTISALDTMNPNAAITMILKVKVQ